MVLVTFLLDPYKNDIKTSYYLWIYIPVSVGLFQQPAEKSSIAPGHHAVFLALARLQREKRALGKELSEAALKEGLLRVPPIPKDFLAKWV